MPKNHFLLFSIIWFCLTFYGLIFYTPIELKAPPFPYYDKFVHCALFFGQFWLLGKCYLKEERLPPFKVFFIFAVLWAIVSEVLQETMTTTRSGDILDAFADIVGAIVAMLLARYLWSLQNKLRLLKTQSAKDASADQ